MSWADRWPHVMEIENRTVHSRAANTGRRLVGLGHAVENTAPRAGSTLRQTMVLSMQRQRRATAGLRLIREVCVFQRNPMDWSPNQCGFGFFAVFRAGTLRVLRRQCPMH